MDFFDQFPVMEQQELRDFKKGIDLAFRTFAGTYGEAIENFFEPLLNWFILLTILNDPKSPNIFQLPIKYFNLFVMI